MTNLKFDIVKKECIQSVPMGEKLINSGIALENKKENLDVFFEHKFLSGHVFKVTLNEDSTLSAGFYLGKKMIFDFSSLLPEGWVFADEKYAEIKAREISFDRKINPGWKVLPELKIIQFFLFLSGPKCLMSILHEIGHARNDKDAFEKRKQFSEEIENAKRQKSIDFEVVISKEEARVVSFLERRAWAYAISTLRNILLNIGVDVGEIFPNSASLKCFCSECLETYSHSYSWIEEHDPDFIKTLEKLFEKKKPTGLK